MRLRRVTAVFGVLVLGIVGCEGAALVPRGFEGDAVFTARLMVRDAPGMSKSEASRPLRALFWHPRGIESGSDDTQLREQPGTSRFLDEGMQELNVFDWPGLDLLATAPGGGRYGLGRLRAYDDIDGDGLRDDDEPWLGDSKEGLLYVPEPLRAAQSPFDRPLPSGMFRVDLPVACGPGPRGADDCGAAIGKSCYSVDECGTGTCLTSQGREWETKICGLPVEVGDVSCLPADAGLYRAADGEWAYFVPACESSADCRGRLYCDHGQGVCLSDNQFTLTLGGDGPREICLPPLGG